MSDNQAALARRHAPWLIPLAAGLVAFVLLHHLSWRFPKSTDQVNCWLGGVDMADGNWRLAGWHLPANNFWLEDFSSYMLLHLVWRLFGFAREGPRLLALLPALIWASCVVVSVRLAVPKSERTRDAGVAALVLLALAGLPMFRGGGMFMLALAPIHLATTLLLLLAACALARAATASAARALGLWSVLLTTCLFVAVASDPLALYVGALPCAAAAFWARTAHEKARFALFTAVVAAVLLARTVIFWVTAHGGFTQTSVPTAFSRFEWLGTNVALTTHALLQLWNADPFGRPLTESSPELLHVPLLILACAVVWRAARSVAAGPGRDGVSVVLFLMFAADAAALLLSSRVEVENGQITALRYLFPAGFAGAILAARALPASRLVAAAAIAGLVGTALGNRPVWLRPPSLLTGAQQQILDKLSARGETAGVGPYWVAAPVTMASGGTVRVFAGDAAPWGGGKIVPATWNCKPFTFPDWSRRAFFVILAEPADSYYPENVRLTFGEPAERVNVGPYAIWFYPKRTG